MMHRRLKLKVYGISTFVTGTQRRAIAAVTGQVEMAKLIGSSVRYVRGYGAVTGNSVELRIAWSHPHTLFVQCGECRSWHEWPKKVLDNE